MAPVPLVPSAASRIRQPPTSLRSLYCYELAFTAKCRRRCSYRQLSTPGSCSVAWWCIIAEVTMLSLMALSRDAAGNKES